MYTNCTCQNELLYTNCTCQNKLLYTYCTCQNELLYTNCTCLNNLLYTNCTCQNELLYTNCTCQNELCMYGLHQEKRLRNPPGLTRVRWVRFLQFEFNCVYNAFEVSLRIGLRFYRSNSLILFCSTLHLYIYALKHSLLAFCYGFYEVIGKCSSFFA